MQTYRSVAYAPRGNGCTRLACGARLTATIWRAHSARDGDITTILRRATSGTRLERERYFFAAPSLTYEPT